MLFNYSNDPREYMYYKGDFYLNGTQVEFTGEFLENNKIDGKKMCRYGEFVRQQNFSDGVGYYFRKINPYDKEHRIDYKEFENCADGIRITAMNIEDTIKDIIRPFKLEREKTDAILYEIIKPKSDFDYPALIVLWIVYIAVMAGSLIFKQFYIIWIIVSWVFYETRRKMLD